MSLILDKDLTIKLLLVYIFVFSGQVVASDRGVNLKDCANNVDWGTQTAIRSVSSQFANQARVAVLSAQATDQQGAAVCVAKYDGAALGLVEKLRAQYPDNDYDCVDHEEIRLESEKRLAAIARSSIYRSFFNPLICSVIVKDTRDVESKVGFHGIRKCSLLVAHIQRCINQKTSDKSAEFSVDKSLPGQQKTTLVGDREAMVEVEIYTSGRMIYRASLPMNYKIKNAEGQEECLLTADFVDFLKGIKTIYAHYADQQYTNCTTQRLVTLDFDVETKRLSYLEESK